MYAYKFLLGWALAFGLLAMLVLLLTGKLVPFVIAAIWCSLCLLASIAVSVRELCRNITAWINTEYCQRETCEEEEQP